MKKYNLTEELNSQRSEGYYQMYGSRDFYRGTSFKMSKWETNAHYFNDEHIIDFVSYKGALLTCMRSHLSSIHNEPKLLYDKDVVIGVEPNQFWEFVLGNSGKGQQGDKGDPFTYEDFTQEQLAALIGPPGKDGINGIGVVAGGATGQALVKKSNSDYDTEWRTISEGGIVPTFSAEATAQSGAIASATATLENDTFKFNFTLPKGKDGIPGKDGTDGTDGTDGISIKIMYAKTTTSIPPVVNKTNPNPGPVWGTSVPMYTTSEYIWSITSSFRDVTLIGEWSDPILMTGEKGDKGESAISPNWKSYIYKLSDGKPEKPTGTNPNPSGWSDYPTTSGNWWQCIGTVNGSTQLVIEWSEVLPVNGRDGTAQDGKFTEFRFAINTSNITPPVLNNTIRTPNGWSIAPQNKAADSYIWMIIATINPDDTLYTNWSTPVVISGENGSNGQDGIPGTPGNDGRTSYFHIKYSAISNPTTASQITETPNTYIGTYVDFIQADSNDPLDYTWSRFEGLQGDKGEQGIPGINGEDGTTSYLHIKYSNDEGTTFTSNNGETPGAWIGIYVDNILNDSDDPKQYKWSKLLGDTGPTGNPGPAGKDGVSGIPGVGIEVRFCLGTDAEYTGVDNLGSNREPTGWEITLPIVTEEYPYIWFTQARINYANNSDRVGTILGTWSTPSKLSGTNGLDGLPGSKGQIIYPEGIYSTSIVYACTETKAPYVYDSNDGNFYVLNKLGTWQGVLHSNQTPSTDTSGSWLLLEAFEGIYAKVGILGNALIGSAVFNHEFMFSQQGIDASGNVTTKYEDFDPLIPTGGKFTPNILFNFETGESHLGAGKITFSANGNIDTKSLKLSKSSSYVFTPVIIDSMGNGNISDLNSEIKRGSYDSGIKVVLSITGDNTTYNIGNRYNGSIINNDDYPVYITSTTSTFLCAVHDNADYDISVKHFTAVRLGPGTSMYYTFVPETKTLVSGKLNEYIYSGELTVNNSNQFSYLPIGDNYTPSGIPIGTEMISAQGSEPASIQSGIAVKGKIILNNDLTLSSYEITDTAVNCEIKIRSYLGTKGKFILEPAGVSTDPAYRYTDHILSQCELFMANGAGGNNDSLQGIIVCGSRKYYMANNSFVISMHTIGTITGITEEKITIPFFLMKMNPYNFL